MDRRRGVFGLPRYSMAISVLPSLTLPPIDNAETVLDTVNHAEQSQAAYAPAEEHIITPTFFIRKSPLPTRGDLDLLRRCLILRTRLLKEKKQGV